MSWFESKPGIPAGQVQTVTEDAMHHAFAPRFAIPFRVALLVAGCVAVPSAARADSVYAVSMTNGGLFRFDSADPYGTMTILSGTGTFASPSALALGPDGNLYVGDGTLGGRIARYNLTTGSVSTVAFVSGTDGYSGPVLPASIAFRPAGQGGQMLVGRSPLGSAYGYPTGPVLQITGWDGNSPVVANYTTGTAQTYAPGLAVAADGTLYVSNHLYNPLTGSSTGEVLTFSGTGTYQGVAVPDGSESGGVAGPAGLVLSGSTLYTASVMNGSIFATNLATGSTVPFGPSISGYFEVGPLAQLSSGGLLTGGVGGSGNIYKVWSSGSSTLYDSTVAINAPYNLGEAFNLGQIGGLVTMVVPEPGTLVLAGAGLAAAGACFRRRRPVA